MGRKFVGCELKESYYRVAEQNLRRAVVESGQMDMFNQLDMDAEEVAA
jgi:predicted O-methyltransferase YrrM